MLVSKKFNFSLLVAYTCLFLLISLKSYAWLGDISAPLRCDETYKVDNLCFPTSAILQPDGRCVCPSGGCTDCPTDSTGTIEDYYCQYPINVLSTVSNRDLNIGFNATVTLHYEKLFYPNSCGSRHASGFSCPSLFLLSAPAIAIAAATVPIIGAAAVIAGLGLTCGVMEGEGDKSGWSSDNRLNVLFDSPEGPSPDDYDSTPGQIVTEAFQSSAAAINPNRYYGIQPRLEFTNIGGISTPIVKFYFTQADKYDVWQLLFPNIESGSTKTDYFDFAETSFPRGNNWGTPLAGIGVSAVWRSIKLCDTHGNPGRNSSGGVDCENTSYFQGLLVDSADESKGFKIPPPPAEPFFPSEMDLFQGGSFRMLAPPEITWQLASSSTFTNPVIDVTFTDALDAVNNSTNATVNILEQSAMHTHQGRWRYQLYSKIEENDNVINQKKICLYACPLAISGPVCRDDAAVPATGLSIDALLSNVDADIKNSAKNEFVIAHTDLDNCRTLPEITGAGSISITGLGIGSTYNDPKIRVVITQGGVSTVPKIYSIMNKQEIHDTVNMIENTTTTYLHNSDGKALFKPQISSIRQDLDLGVVQSATGPACTSNSNCPSEYICCAPVCPTPNSCTTPVTCANSFCTAEGKLCQLYNSTNHAVLGSYLQTCNTPGTVTANLNSLSEDAKSFICLHNVYPVNTTPKPHPYNVNTNIISNTYSDDPAYSGANRNLCVPAPKKIESFSYVMVDDNKANPISDVSVTYRKPKPFLTYEDNDFAVLSASDQGSLMSNQVIPVLNDYTGPALSAANLVETIRYDYHNNLRFTYENSNGIYSVSLEKYNYATSTWETPSITGLDGSGKIVNSATGNHTTNLNYCPAGLLPGVPNSDMPLTPANATNVVGSCTSSCVAGSNCVDPQANCNTYGVWQSPIEGFCVNACPAKTVDVVNGSIDIPGTISSNSGSVAVTETGSCDAGYVGVITATDNCQSDGTWENEGSETITGNCIEMCSSNVVISIGGTNYTYILAEDYYEGDTVSATCGDFGLSSGGSLTLTCTDGNFSVNADHGCKRKCGNYNHGDTYDSWGGCDWCHKNRIRNQCNDGSWGSWVMYNKFCCGLW